MRRQFFSANTIEQALMAAGRHFGLDPDRVAYRLRDKKHGFLNIRRRVVIEVDPSAPEKPETAARAVAPAAAAPLEEAAPGILRAPSTRRDDRPGGGRPRGGRSRIEEPRRDRWDGPRDAGPPSPDGREEESVWSLGEAVRKEFAAAVEDLGDDRREEREIAAFGKAVEEVVALLGLRLEGSARRGDDGFEVEITGEDRDFLVEDDGQLLRSIEHLLPRLVRGLLGRGLPCRVDSDGFQAAREEELRELAEEAADRAVEEDRPQFLEPMNPADRRIVHMTLADDPETRTRSEGDGFMKRVRILPVDDGAE